MTHRHSQDKVIVFDWDDTICPSSFVEKWQIETYKDLPLHMQNVFDELGRVAEKCLREASKFGEVIIITNSDEGWVNFSAERFVPNLVPVIARYRIVSARTRYERFYPNQPLCWKAAAFAHEVNEIYKTQDFSMSIDENKSCESLDSTDVSSSSDDSMVDDSQEEGKNEIISFGDSMEERTATRIVSGQLSAIPKSVLFISGPTPEQLIGQLCMVTSYMKYVCENEASLDLEISPSQAQRCAKKHLDKMKGHSVDLHQHVGSPRIRRAVVTPETTGLHQRHE